MSLEEHDGACILGVDLCPECIEYLEESMEDLEDEEEEDADWDEM